MLRPPLEVSERDVLWAGHKVQQHGERLHVRLRVEHVVRPMEEEREDGHEAARPEEVHAELLRGPVGERVGQTRDVHALDEGGGVDDLLEHDDGLSGPLLRLIVVGERRVGPGAELGVMDAELWVRG